MSKSGDLKGRAEDASLVVAASGGGSMVGDEWLTLLDVGSLIRAIDAKISAFMTKHFKDVAAAKVKPLSDESIINGLYQIVRDDFNAFKFGMDISDDTEPEKKSF